MYDGNTRLFFTIGQPVSIIRIPKIMPAVFRAVGVDAVWLTLNVDPGQLPAALAGLRQIRNLGGLSITMPHKGDALALVDRATARARACGAINLLRFEADGSMTGDSVDGLGFVEGLKARGFDPAGKRAWVLGSGGAGAAIAAALCEAGVASLAITDLATDRVMACRDRLAAVFPTIPVTICAGPPADVDLAVNATPCGLQPNDPLPFDPVQLPPDVMIGEVIMSPPETALVKAARAAGRAVQPGRHMLDYQIDHYLRFFGIDCDQATVLAAIV